MLGYSDCILVELRGKDYFATVTLVSSQLKHLKELLAYEYTNIWWNTNYCTIYTCMMSQCTYEFFVTGGYRMGLDLRKPVFIACFQQRCRSACANAQSNQHLSFSISRKHNSLWCNMPNFNIPASRLVWDLIGQKPQRQVFSRWDPYVSKTTFKA